MINPISKIKDEDIKKVAQLRDRPNLNGAYGQAKLTAQQLKEWFDQYPDIVRNKVDEILDKFLMGNGDYIQVGFPDEEYSSLADMISAIFTGAFANQLIVKLAENSDEKSLASLLNEIKEELAQQIITSQISDGAVTTDKLSTGAVTESKIASGAITTDKIADREVTTEKLENDSVTSEKISTRSVSKIKLTDDVAGLIDDSIKSVSYDRDTGILLFRTNANKTISIDLPLEMLVESGAYDDASKSIVLTLANKDKITIPVTSLMTEINNKMQSFIDDVTIVDRSDGTRAIHFKKANGIISFDLRSFVPGLSITAEKLASGAVTRNKIADESVYPNNLAPSLSDSISQSVIGARYDEERGAMIFTQNSQFAFQAPLPIPKIEKKQTELESRIDTLEGLTLKTITDTFVAYTKSVPAPVAPYATVNKVGGMTYKTDEGFRDSKVTAIVSRGKNLAYKQYGIECSGAAVDSTVLRKESESDTLKCCYSLIPVVGGNTYAISKTYADKSSNFRYFWFDKEPVLNETKSIGGQYVTAQATFVRTAPENAKYLYVYWTQDEIKWACGDVQIELGDTVTEYAPYHEGPIDTVKIHPEAISLIPLNGYGKGIDATDYNYIDFDNEQYVQVCEELILTGEETVEVASFTGNSQDVMIYDVLPDFSPSINGICTDCDVAYYEHKPNSMVLGDNDSTIYWTGILDILGISTADEFKSYLANRYANGNPVRILYKLSEPIITDVSGFFSDTLIEVVGSGSIVAVNEHNQAVPTTITYITKS